jgi:GntR family transcriptional regulator, transcriptional repressor for pyruvate dehydrogenase complex
VSLGFQAEPYSPEIRAVAIDQHRELVQAVVDGRADDAAALAAEHFSLTEGALRRLLDRVQEGR